MLCLDVGGRRGSRVERESNLITLFGCLLRRGEGGGGENLEGFELILTPHF